MVRLIKSPTSSSDPELPGGSVIVSTGLPGAPGPPGPPGEGVTEEEILELETKTDSQAKFDQAEADLTAHEVDTTAVHGITDTSLLETQAGAQNKANAAASAAQTAAHSYTDTTVAPLATQIDDLEASFTSFLGMPPAELDTWTELIARLQTDEAGTAALVAQIAAKQDASPQLTALAGVISTAFGRNLLTLTDLPALRTLIGLATIATTGSIADLSETPTLKIMTAAERAAIAANSAQVAANTAAISANTASIAGNTTAIAGKANKGNLTAVPVGRWWNPAPGASTNVVQVLNEIRGVAILAPFDLKIDVIRFNVQAAGATGALYRVGFCLADASGQPNLDTVVDLGQQSAEVVGLKDWTAAGQVIPAGNLFYVLTKAEVVGSFSITSAGFPYNWGMFFPDANTGTSTAANTHLARQWTTPGFPTNANPLTGLNTGNPPRPYFRQAA